LAEAALAAGQTDRALKYLERSSAKATDPAPLLRLADLLARQKSWTDAADRYRQAWEKDRKQPLPLFLRGQALVQAGQEAEGKKLMEAAHILPLGNEYVRYQFAKALAERGFGADAQRERELLLKVGALDGWAINESYRLLAYAAQARKDYLGAADWLEKFRLRCLRINVNFVEYSAHVQVPAMVHQNRARGLAAAGKFDEAKKEWQLCLKLTPGNLNVPIHLVPVLEKAGRQNEADELFNEVFTLHEKLCKDYPQSATNHNTLAWLAAVCRRRLDLAEQHAARAVELDSANAGYLDTLAEANFQRGNMARAVELMKRSLELDPKNEYFRKQLKRFEAGDPKAELPDDAD
jgi:tetratricopeptide (TPR) repeat protein